MGQGHGPRRGRDHEMVLIRRPATIHSRAWSGGPPSGAGHVARRRRRARPRLERGRGGRTAPIGTYHVTTQSIRAGRSRSWRPRPCPGRIRPALAALERPSRTRSSPKSPSVGRPGRGRGRSAIQDKRCGHGSTTLVVVVARQEVHTPGGLDASGRRRRSAPRSAKGAVSGRGRCGRPGRARGGRHGRSRGRAHHASLRRRWRRDPMPVMRCRRFPSVACGARPPPRPLRRKTIRVDGPELRISLESRGRRCVGGQAVVMRGSRLATTSTRAWIGEDEDQPRAGTSARGRSCWCPGSGHRKVDVRSEERSWRTGTGPGLLRAPDQPAGQLLEMAGCVRRRQHQQQPALTSRDEARPDEAGWACSG